MIATKKHIDVPAEFCFEDKYPYPHFNIPDFEYWFAKNYRDEYNKSDRIFLPITFTSYHKLHGYGKSNAARKRLQDFVNKLDKSLKYFCCVQYDDGTLIDWENIDVKIYEMCGNHEAELNYPLPLIAQPYPKQPQQEKKYLANFIGRITHPIRQKMIDAVMNKQGYYVSTANHSVDHYTKVMAQSNFTLVPAGYGRASFRCAECILQGSIPVYLCWDDEFVISHKVPFDYYGVLIKEKDINNIDAILKAIPESEIKRKQSVLQEVYETLYTYEGTKHLILEDLKNEN